MIVSALLVAVLLHILIIGIFQFVELRILSKEHYDEIVPRAFDTRKERAQIDPEILEVIGQPQPTPQPVTRPIPDPPKAVMPPVESKLEFFEDGSPTGTPDVIPDVLATEKPLTPDALDLSGLEGKEAGADFEDVLQAGTLVKPGPENPARPTLNEGFGGTGEGGGGGAINLDELLRLSGPPPPNQRIILKGEVLFEYDSSQLRPEGIAELEKLARYLQEFPETIVRIEGYTDAYGSEEYNQSLSETRAQAVANWLIVERQMHPKKVEAYGLGSSNLRTPRNASVQEQEINRRVEIILNTP